MSVEERAKEFVAAHKSLVLATVDMIGNPTASYAPFVRANGNLYVYTSAMSRHTKDMIASPRASAMIMEDISQASNIFAPKRITLSCVVEVVRREYGEWFGVISLFDKNFGKAFEPLKSLSDFTLFRLDPIVVLYVEGFGRAFRLSKDLEQLEHITGSGMSAHK